MSEMFFCWVYATLAYASSACGALHGSRLSDLSSVCTLVGDAKHCPGPIVSTGCETDLESSPNHEQPASAKIVARAVSRWSRRVMS